MIALFLARYGLKKKICGLYCSRQALIYVPKVTSAKSFAPNYKVPCCLDQGSSVKKRKRHENKKRKENKTKNRNYGRLKYFFWVH